MAVGTGMTEPRQAPRKTGEMLVGTGRLSGPAVASALALQRTIVDATGRWLRVGEILLLRGDLSAEMLAALRGSALFSVVGTALPEAELYGEIALRMGFLKPEEFVEGLAIQAAERRDKKPHRLIGTILVEKGFLKPKHLQSCEEEFRRDLRLHHDEVKRANDAAEQPSDKPVFTPIDAQYVRAARAGELPTEEIVSALGAWKKIQKLLDRKVALWEYLVVRGIVTIDTHRRMLEKSCNIKSASFGSWMIGGVLVELGYASAADVESALAERNAGGPKAKRVGDILVERRVISRAELEEALRVQALRRKASKRPTVAEEVTSRFGRKTALAVAGIVLAFVVGFGVGSLRTSIAYRTLADGAAPLGLRLSALDRLVAREGREADPAVIAAAGRRDGPVAFRVACLLALEESLLPKARDVLAAALKDESPRVRAAACWALAERRVRALEAPLRKCLADKDAALALAAARALALLFESDGRDALVGALAPTHPERRRLAEALSIDEARIVRAVIQALETVSGFRFGERLPRWEAWRALQAAADDVVGRRRGPEVVARFTRLLESPRTSSRFAAARGLAHLADPRGAALLVAALDANEEDLRLALKAERDIDIETLAPEITALLELLTGESHQRDAEAWLRALDALEARRRKAAAPAPAPAGAP